MIVKVAKALGLNSDQKAALANSFGEGDNLFLSLVILECDDAFVRGRQVLSDLADSYFVSEENISERLSNLFSEAHDSLKDINFSILLGVVSAKALYLIGQGEIAVHLKRIGKVSALPANTGQLISGFLQVGDRVFLATTSLISLLGDDLKEVIGVPFDDFEDELNSRINGNEGIAGLMVDIESEEEEVVIPKSVEEGRLSELPLNFLAKIKSVFPNGGRLRVILALILILFIATGAGLKFKSTKDHERDVKFNELMTQARDDYQAALGLKTLSPAEATLKVVSAKDNLDKALKLKPSDASALELKKQIEEGGAALGQKFETNFSEYLNLELVKTGFRASQMSLSVGKLLLLNPDDATLVVIDIDKKSQQVLAGRERLGGAKFASVNGDVAFSFSEDKGVVRVDLGSEKASVSAKLDKEWGQIGDLYGFGGNVYLLDKTAPPAGGQIWKYLAISGGYSDKRKYLVEGAKADFGNALRMQIESSVYVLKSGGEILRFTRGEQDNFSIGGLDKGIKDPKSIFVSSETDNLYVLDSGNSRLVVLTKTGAYVSQYTGDKFGSATDLVVDEKGKKVYLLENSKIYVTELK